MIGPAQILRRWWARRNHVELPLVAIPAVMDDDDTLFWGDLLYFRGLLDHIEHDCARSDVRLKPIDPAASGALDAALELIRDDWFFSMAVPA